MEMEAPAPAVVLENDKQSPERQSWTNIREMRSC